MRRAYVFRLRPTARQHVALAACLEVHRELYDAALQERRDAWSLADPHLLRGSVGAAERDPVRAPIRRCGRFPASRPRCGVNKAFEGFLPRVKPGVKRLAIRVQRGKVRFDSVQWPKDGDGARWLPEQRRVYLQGIGQVKVQLHRQVPGRVKTIQVKRQGRALHAGAPL